MVLLNPDIYWDCRIKSLWVFVNQWIMFRATKTKETFIVDCSGILVESNLKLFD